MKDNALATHLYYIAQEAVNNAVKHSDATRITITLDQQKGYLNLRVTDNGRGIEPDSDNRGIGLQIMKYRALVIGAFLKILPAEGGGTSYNFV